MEHVDAVQISLAEVTGLGDADEFEETRAGIYEGPAGSEFEVYESYEDAENEAYSRVKDMLEDEPELFNQTWIQNWLVLSPTDQRLWARDLAGEWDEDEETEDEHLERIEDYERRLDRDPIEVFEEIGLDPFQYLNVDSAGAAQNAVDIDGVAHFLAGYDGELVELEDGKVAFRIN